MTGSADISARVRALLKQCCVMCGPSHEHACDRRTPITFEPVDHAGSLDPVGPLDPGLQARLTGISGLPLTRTNHVRLLRDGADAFTAMLELIERAQVELLLENYIFRADAVGYGYGRALTTRAREGVDVRVLHDPFGDLLSVIPLHLVFWGSQARLSMYNPPRPTWRYLRAWRDHRKLVVQDRARLVAGGLCVADVWVGNCVRQCTWREEAFDRLWQDAFALTWRRARRSIAPPGAPAVAGDVPVRILADGPGRRCTAPALTAVIEAARSEVLITNQYLVPTPRLMSAIVGAARRGVSVEVIVPPRSSPRVVGWATEHRLGTLLDAGVRVWHWTGAMLHAKTVVVDRRWSLIGSTNLDWLSLRRNAELNVEIHGSRIGDQMAEMFAADRALCRPFGLQEWRTWSRIRRVLTSACAAADVLL